MTGSGIPVAVQTAAALAAAALMVVAALDKGRLVRRPVPRVRRPRRHVRKP